MNVLIACEESQEVCKAFRERGHQAFSCDIQDCSGGHPEWHIKGDVLSLLNGRCKFMTMDWKLHSIFDSWDLIIAHPPCTYLSYAANQCHSLHCYNLDQIAERTQKRIMAMQFFMKFVTCDCEKVVIENPQGIMSACYRKPDQVIHPYYFADSVDDLENYATKRTGLWLKGVPPLIYLRYLPDPMENTKSWKSGKKICWTELNHGGKNRSKTFPGIAQAMADQWG